MSVFGQLLVFGRRLWMPGHQVFAFVILAVHHLAAYRVAVDVHIEGTHEDRKLKAPVSEVFIGLYFPLKG